MNHLGTVQIETNRLILRKSIMSVEVAECILSDWIDSYTDNKFYQWAIVLKENSDEPIGTISAVRMNEEIDMVHIGYCIGRKWQHKGITTEAFKGIIPFLIEKVKVKRIESRHDPRNPNSGKVMLKCGLTFKIFYSLGDFEPQIVNSLLILSNSDAEDTAYGQKSAL